jgi:hypothetical protein
VTNELMVFRRIFSWLGLGTPKPKEDEELLAMARKIAKNMDGELVLPSDPDELKAELSKLRKTVEQTEGFLGGSAEEWSEIFTSKEWKDARKNEKEYWRYSVTVQPSIPLAILEREGEISYEENPELIGEPNGTNEETGEAYNHLGIWIKRTTMQDEMFPETDSDRQRKNRIEFLKEFRKIYENDENDVEQRIGDINALRDNSKYQEPWDFFTSGRDFPKSMFIADICILPGISAKRAEELWQLGLKTPDAVKNAPDEVLLSVSGIGKKTLEKIKSS